METMNEISIIINGVRYDAVERNTKRNYCHGCDLFVDCQLSHCCEDLIGLNRVLKKSDKKFEK